jgi:hypothetical protein
MYKRRLTFSSAENEFLLSNSHVIEYFTKKTKEQRYNVARMMERDMKTKFVAYRDYVEVRCSAATLITLLIVASCRYHAA